MYLPGILNGENYSMFSYVKYVYHQRRQNMIDTGRFKKNAWILLYQKNCCNFWTKQRIYKLLFSPENWDPYPNFEYRTNAVRFYAAKIFAKQNGTFVISWRARTKFSYFKPLHILGANQNKKKIWKFLTSLYNIGTLMVN